ncbi:MAG: threo-3-hydroxy-L-aspartate ammonia-lyase [Leptolyngbyaceae cyanobacterium MO_188.B28]|nr:threo-3-hydroxy-L-aspartate ammonia-lyase [Leptolyngbyaceae cyanobacterium MO_188.B28]
MNPTFEQIQAAAARLQGHAHLTPIMTSQTLNHRLGSQVFLKCENLQKGGAFKIRGAFNAIAQLNESERAQGIITYSSGNHAQALALVGRMLGIQTTVVMPDNASLAKRTATEGYGAKVALYDPVKTTREDAMAALQTDQTFIPPFDHPDVIAGQGTAALELFNQVGQLDALLVPCGGGGLLSGSAIAAKRLCPSCRVIGVEPALADDATRSFHTKQLQTVKNPQTIADGTRSPSLGNLTFPLILRYVDQMMTVSEDAIKEAVRFFFYRLKLVVEPSGALGTAALLSGRAPVEGRIGVILSGGNIDGAMMSQILNQEISKV